MNFGYATTWRPPARIPGGVGPPKSHLSRERRSDVALIAYYQNCGMGESAPSCNKHQWSFLILYRPGPHSCFQRTEQCFRVPQVLRIEAFRKPAIDGPQQVVCFIASALCLPKSGKAA